MAEDESPPFVPPKEDGAGQEPGWKAQLSALLPRLEAIIPNEQTKRERVSNALKKLEVAISDPDLVKLIHVMEDKGEPPCSVFSDDRNGVHLEVVIRDPADTKLLKAQTLALNDAKKAAPGIVELRLFNTQREDFTPLTVLYTRTSSGGEMVCIANEIDEGNQLDSDYPSPGFNRKQFLTGLLHRSPFDNLTAQGIDTRIEQYITNAAKVLATPTDPAATPIPTPTPTV